MTLVYYFILEDIMTNEEISLRIIRMNANVQKRFNKITQKVLDRIYSLKTIKTFDDIKKNAVYELSKIIEEESNNHFNIVLGDIEERIAKARKMNIKTLNDLKDFLIPCDSYEEINNYDFYLCVFWNIIAKKIRFLNEKIDFDSIEKDFKEKIKIEDLEFDAYLEKKKNIDKNLFLKKANEKIKLIEQRDNNKLINLIIINAIKLKYDFSELKEQIFNVYESIKINNQIEDEWLKEIVINEENFKKIIKKQFIENKELTFNDINKIMLLQEIEKEGYIQKFYILSLVDYVINYQNNKIDYLKMLNNIDKFVKERICFDKIIDECTI